MTPSPNPSGDSVRYPGVYHKDGPLAQVRQMADWTEAETVQGLPNKETLRKIAANLRAAADALALSPNPQEAR